MITLRRGQDRFHTAIDWLDSRHTFSFGEHRDPRFMGFRSLRVINDDRVAASGGFGTHGHRDMEIVTYVLDGALEHRDSLGTGSTIRPGDVQRMTAGTGVLHSEFNPSADETSHFLQIWILPERAGLAPSYEQRHFEREERRDRLRLVASHDGRDGSITVHQDVALFAALLGEGSAVSHELSAGRHAYVHVARGALSLDGTPLVGGDGAAISEVRAVSLVGSAPETEVLLFDLA